MHLRKVALLAAFGVAGAFAACTLNPQPLPPSDEASSFGDDASNRSDSGSFTGPDTPNSDAAATPPPDNEGGTGNVDGGDGGSDAGDGGSDAGDASDSG